MIKSMGLETNVFGFAASFPCDLEQGTVIRCSEVPS